ncbi:hypothetical protein SAMN04487905_12123 [Actinopolyspora xinjiangensis]|uniref:FtsK domain-containing protein n=1 Tax=Actinopolyspora xinjiangensis TaxID=405564 RepID=A0A1H0X158_9ACTN|nr:hypothetical protein [Actinopolyspora xinjiangensis]SDP96697.1 hypothetical protein SAMN04487905_12123 [Actinopolyspora xinjiangensis]
MTETAVAKVDHSDGISTSPEGTQRTQSVLREIRRLTRRYRMQAMPFAAIGATHGIGAVAAALDPPEALLPVAAGWTASAGIYGYVHRNASRWDRLYACVAAGSSAGWQAALALAGANGVTAGLMWAFGAALSIPWWVRHAEPEPDVTAELAAPPQPREALPVAPGTADRQLKLWNEHIAANGKPLPGSALDGITEFAYGWKATVTLAIGEHWHTTLQARKSILSVYDLPDGRVFVEAMHGESVRKSRLTVLTSDPLQQKNHWNGPGLDPATGKFPLMIAADGEPLHFKLWNPGAGALHALISGVTRSGKTKVLDVVLTEASMSDRVYPLVIDGGGGASLPQWRERANLFAGTPEQAREVLRYTLRLIERRRPVVERQGGGSLEPSPELPLVPVVIDEAHKLLMSDDETDNRDIVRMCEQITQEGAKFGVCLILATQVPSVKQLGNSTALRDQVKAGTIVGLRITEKGSGNMIDTGDPMPEHLKDLPAEFPDGSSTHGLGYMMTSRKIRARALLLENPAEQPVTPTGLDPDSAAEPVPALNTAKKPAETAPPRRSSGPTAEDIDATVREAIAAGTEPAVDELMRDTGLAMTQVRAALKRI